MALSKSSLAIFAIIISMTMAATSGQNTPQDFLNLHNIARAADGVGPVNWDSTVAKFAKDYAAKLAVTCRLQHSGGPYGENIFGSTRLSSSAADAVASWVAEKKYYHYDTNTCDPGKVCGHYKQVVWRESTRIGCARVVCAEGDAVFIICEYDPSGNTGGRRPFLTLDKAAM